MATWFGTQTQDGDLSVGTEDIIQDSYYSLFGTYPSNVEIVHFNFYCQEDCEVEIDGRTNLWLKAGTEIEFETEWDKFKMPKKNFKILTSDVTYEYTIILR